MTDTTNHAEVIKDALGMLDPSHRRDYMEALTALDALTRGAEDTKRSLRIQADHAAELEKAEVAQSARIATQSAHIRRLEAALACNVSEDYLSLQALYVNQLNEAKIKAARIATLEGALTAILGRDHHLYCVCGRAMSRIPEGVREQARAALAPIKGER